MSPVGVMIIYLLLPFLMALGSGLSARLAKSIGRSQTMTLLKVVGIALLVTMALLATYWFDAPLTSGHVDPEKAARAREKAGVVKVGLMVVIYLVRRRGSRSSHTQLYAGRPS